MSDARRIVANASHWAGRFFAWWGQELVDCLPRRLRDLIVPPKSQLVIEILKEGALRFSRLSPEGKETLTTVRPRDEASSENLHELGSSSDAIVVSLPDSCGVKRRVELPAAARENLREVVAMEMDRLTPFKFDEVYFQIGRIERGRTDELIGVDLTVVPRGLADDAVRMARMLGVDPDTLSLGEPAPDGSNLVALDSSKLLRTPRLISRGFALAAALLLMAIGAAPFIEQARDLRQLEEAVGAADKNPGNGPQAQLVVLSNGAQRLSALRHEEPFAVGVLDELSRALPKGTWLSEIDLDRTKISLSGFSDNAAALLSLLEQLPHIQGVKFDEAVAFDDRQHKDRFRLSASVVPAKPSTVR